jgi:uncharacterized protein involved in exopolysaccharide biosynthesis
MVAMGAITGSRFANTPPRLLLNFVGAAFGSFAVAVAIAAVCGRSDQRTFATHR